jgi:hypothetical protein
VSDAGSRAGEPATGVPPSDLDDPFGDRLCESRVGVEGEAALSGAGEEGAAASRTDGRGAVTLTGAWSLSLIASTAGAAR